MSQPPSPSGDRAAAGGRDYLTFRTLALVTGVLLAVRLAAAGLVHPFEDEAYYRLWSLHPQAGYFDHPPMIAWWIWLGTHIVGDNALGIRLLPVLASAVTSFLVFDMARLAGASERTAVRAGVWYNAVWLVGVGSALAVPDAPAGLFWQTALWCVLRSLQSPRAGRWWLAAGAAAGLATLSKYSALFLAPGILALLILSPRGRAQLKTPWPWLAIVVAALVFGVNVVWNAEHHWVSFVKQFGRVAPAHFSPAFLAEFLAGQFLALNPLIVTFAVWGLVSRTRARGAGDAWGLLAVSAPFLIYLLIHSLHDRVQAHWPSPLYPALAICAAMAAEQIKPGSWLRWLRTATPFLGFAVTAAALIYGVFPWPSGKGDLAQSIRGWSDFGRRVEATRVQSGAGWVATLSYGEAAQLSGAREIHAPVLQLGERDRYAVMGVTAPADLSRPGLVVEMQRRISPQTLSACFTNVRPLGEIDRTPDRHARYEAFLVSGPKQLVEGGCWADRTGPSPSLALAAHH
jgi:4-amino-4-deoxy-L-arabinose transferase-like glycosyltransferase